MLNSQIPKLSNDDWKEKIRDSERKKARERESEREMKRESEKMKKNATHYIHSMSMTINIECDLNFSLVFRLVRPFISRTLHHAYCLLFFFFLPNSIREWVFPRPSPPTLSLFLSFFAHLKNWGAANIFIFARTFTHFSPSPLSQLMFSVFVFLDRTIHCLFLFEATHYNYSKEHKSVLYFLYWTMLRPPTVFSMYST